MDTRKECSRADLRGALIACMKEKPFSEISIAEVCRRAGKYRTSFYRHYSSLDDIVAELEQEQLEAFRRMLQRNDRSGKELLVEILDSIDTARAMYRSIGSSELSERFKNGLIATAKEFGLQKWKDSLPKVDELSAEISYEALLAGTLQAVTAMGERVSNEKKAELIYDMIRAYIQSRA